jgi:hypothetical protein
MSQGWIRRMLKEPLVHFLGLSLLIFLAYRALIPLSGVPEDEIVVTPSRIEQLGAVFSRTWQRPPTSAELKDLIDDYVKEEIYVREAQRLGLAEDDTVIRRRLRLKMEFLADMESGLQPPADAVLQTYLDAHPDQFMEPSRYEFEHVFLRSDGRGAAATSDVEALLVALNGSSPPDPAAVGDPTLLPPALANADAALIARDFGEEFATALKALPVGIWAGPIHSTYGLHLVRINKRQDGRLPLLAEVRERVLRAWTQTRRTELEQMRVEELLKRYPVKVMLPGDTSP